MSAFGALTEGKGKSMTETQMLDKFDIQFPSLGWNFHINPTAFTIFGLDIQWYGIIITLGLILAIIYVFPRMKRFGIDSDRAVDAVIGGVIGGIVGARLYYVAMKWEDYKKDSIGETFKAVINTRNGGLAIYGGIIGALIVGYIICRIRKVKVLPMLDITLIGFLIGQGIGRWGNFVNQEAFGTNTDSFLGMTGGTIQRTILNQTQLGGDMNLNGNAEMLWEKAVHPCFLYESVWCLLGFALLAFWSKRRKYDGQITLMYMAWYGAERFIVEGLRTDSLMIGNIRVSQALSALIFVASVMIQIVMFFRIRRDPESCVLYASTEESRLMIEESRRKRMGIKGADARIMGDDDDEIGDLGDDFDSDDDDEIGELPDEDDDDEIGELPDEEDELSEETDEAESVEEEIPDDEIEAEPAEEEAPEETDEAEPAEEEAPEDTDEAEPEEEEVYEETDEAEPEEEEASEDTDEDESDDEYDDLAEEYDDSLSGGGKGSHSKKKKHQRK